MRYVTLKGYYWHVPAADSKPIAEKYVDAFIERLTTPLTAEEANPPQRQPTPLPNITLTGKSYSDIVGQWQKYNATIKWSDGLGLIPPTREAVEWILTGTSRSRSEVLGTMRVKEGIATIEKIAINAVMAGATPDILPVIIAIVQSLLIPPGGDPEYAFDIMGPQASAGGLNIIIMMSGPIVNELGMWTGEKPFFYGRSPNNTIGRAVRLNTINLGWMWPGINDMGGTRETMTYTYYIAAEYSGPGNPWRPYHEVIGFKPEDSCVTSSTCGSSSPTKYAGKSAKEVIDMLIKEILAKRKSVLSDYKPEIASGGNHCSKITCHITPEMAGALYDLGYTNMEKLQKYIFDATSIPYEELTEQEKTSMQARINQSIANLGITGLRIPPEGIPAWQAGLKPGGKAPILAIPGDLVFFVNGIAGLGFAMATQTSIRSAYTWAQQITTKITGATLTKAGK
jgi:hypothetical protein